MKRILFVVSHLFSGSDNLVTMLNANPRIQIRNSEITYTSPEDLDTFVIENPGAYYGDHLLYNSSFCSKQLYESCKFIYVIRPAKATINLLVENKTFSKKMAVNHYCFRIRRIYEMIKKTPEAVLLTWHDLASGNWLPLVQEYIDLDLEKQEFPQEYAPDKIVPSDLKEADECYEKYLYRMSNL